MAAEERRVEVDVARRRCRARQTGGDRGPKLEGGEHEFAVDQSIDLVPMVRSPKPPEPPFTSPSWLRYGMLM